MAFITKNGDKTSKSSETYAIVIKFDNCSIGQRLIQNSGSLLKKCPHKNVVPITRVNYEYSMGRISKDHSSKAKVFQFPLKLAWAITAHKCQGQTIKPPANLVADINSVFEAGQAYVVLGRVQNIQQLHLLNFKESKLSINANSLNEAEKISAESKIFKLSQSLSKLWLSSSKSHLKVGCLNIEGLGTLQTNGHFWDLSKDYTMLKSDIICLTETSLERTDDAPMLLGYYKPFASKLGKGNLKMYIKRGKH